MASVAFIILVLHLSSIRCSVSACVHVLVDAIVQLTINSHFVGGIFLSEGFASLKVASHKIKPLLPISFEVNLHIIHSKYLYAMQ